MNSYLELSSSPYGENCAQVGSDDYNDKSRIECKAYIQQLNRLFPSLQEGCNFGVKSFPHDFGSYREVCIIYPEKLENCLNDDNCDEDSTCENCKAMKLIYDIENNLPENWDSEAIEYLKENNAL
jgi:hypothetical protein